MIEDRKRVTTAIAVKVVMMPLTISLSTASFSFPALLLVLESEFLVLNVNLRADDELHDERDQDNRAVKDVHLVAAVLLGTEGGYVRQRVNHKEDDNGFASRLGERDHIFNPLQIMMMMMKRVSHTKNNNSTTTMSGQPGAMRQDNNHTRR